MNPLVLVVVSSSSLESMFNKYLSSTYNTPGIIPGIKDTRLTKVLVHSSCENQKMDSKLINKTISDSVSAMKEGYGIE